MYPCLKRSKNPKVYHFFHDPQEQSVVIVNKLKLSSALFSDFKTIITRINQNTFKIQKNLSTLHDIEIVCFASQNSMPLYTVCNFENLDDKPFFKEMIVTLSGEDAYVDIHVLNNHGNDLITYSWNTKLSLCSSLKKLYNYAFASSLLEYAAYIKKIYYKDNFDCNEFQITKKNYFLKNRNNVLEISIPFLSSLFKFFLPYDYEQPAVIKILCKKQDLENCLQIIYMREKTADEKKKNRTIPYSLSVIRMEIDETSVEPLQKIVQLDIPDQVIDGLALNTQHYIPHINEWNCSTKKYTIEKA